MFGVQVSLVLQKEHGSSSGEQIPQRSLPVPVRAPLRTDCGLPAGTTLLLQKCSKFPHLKVSRYVDI